MLRRGLLVQRHGRGAARQQRLAHGGAEVDAPEPATAVRQEGLSHGPELWGLCVRDLCKCMYIYRYMYMEQYHGRSYVIYLFNRYK